MPILGIFFYTLLVGADAAVVRAAFMGSIVIAGASTRQAQQRHERAWAVAVMFMAFINPLVIWDVGFQLSFFATLGLILYAEPFSNFTSNLISKFSKHDTSTFARIFNEIVILTFAAQLTTIPIMAYHFKRISLISFIANPFILPVQPAVMVARRAGCLHQPDHLSAGTTHRVVRLAFRRVHHPHGGIIRPRAAWHPFILATRPSGWCWPFTSRSLP